MTQRKPKSMRDHFGFTLLELLVTVAILAIVVAVGVPGLQSLLSKQALQSRVGLLSSTLAYARNEAVVRVGTVVVCGDNGSTQCNGTSDLSDGWIVFVDANEDGLFNTSDGDELLKQGGQESEQVTLTLASSATHISYSEQGESSDVRSIFMCTDGADSSPSKARTVTISVVGSTRVSTGATCSSGS